ncbi:MAG TPA: hypothetical protein VHO84_04595 [Syntrophorhabdaceae bacterium]|nr:hypothetical protein [Syntrophorhabdaceae bacterium]
MNLPPTSHRITLHSAEWKTEKIEDEMERRLTYYAAHPGEIGKRLIELDQEWDIERILEANASCLSLISLGLAVTVSRKWLVVPFVVSGFLLQHALQGWCPPVPILRALGIRTQYEIEVERYALKIMRSDFKDIDVNTGSLQEIASMASQVVRAVKR